MSDTTTIGQSLDGVAANRRRALIALATARRTVLATALLLLPAAAESQKPNPPVDSAKSSTDPHAAQPERPTVATHAGTVARGWFEIENGGERDTFGDRGTGVVTPTVLKFGIADHAQLSVFAGLAKPAGSGSSLGVGDAAVGVKWRLVDDAPVVGDFAILPSIKFPTGSSTTGAGTGTTDVSLLLISSHDFNGVAMDLNVAYTHRSGDGTNVPTSATLWTASLGGPFTGALGWVVECFGYPKTSGSSGQSSIVALLGGPTLQLQSWLEVDAGVIVPLTGPQPHALYAGVVYNVGRLWGPPQ